MRQSPHRWRPGFLVGVLAATGLLIGVACGGGEEPTPTSPAPTPTSPAPTATSPAPTPTSPAAEGEATPTPTSESVVAEPTATSTPTPTAEPAEQIKRGGILLEQGTSDPPSFDVHTATSSRHIAHNGTMYSGLLVDFQGTEVKTDAAESWDISDDGLTWTIKVKDGVRYHTGYEPAFDRDGTEMTAQDVKWSLEKIMGLHGQLISARSGWMKEFIDIDRPDNGVEVVDDKTVKVHMVQPFPAFALLLAINFTSIVPDGVTREMMQKRPYGSGPFKLQEFQRGAIWKYEANDDYFKPGLPYLDGWHHINIRGTEVIQNAFLTGKFDWYRGNPSPDYEDQFQQKADAGEINVTPYVTSCRPQGTVMNATAPPFDDVQLRQAVNLAIDRDAYIETVHFGNAVPTLLLDPGGWGKTVDEIREMPGFREPHDQDVQTAKEMVAELYPDGLDVPMMIRNTSGYMRGGEFVAGELRKIGINAEIQILDAAQLFPKATNLDYQIWNYWFCQTTMTPAELFGSYFVTGGSRNWFGYSSPEIDAAYLDMVGTQNPVERKKAALELEQKILDDMPLAPTAVNSSHVMMYPYVKGFTMPVGLQYMWPRMKEVFWLDK